MIDKNEILKKVLEDNKEELEKLKGELNDSTPADFTRILLPVIRRIMPEIIASEIVGVQPMGDRFNKYYTNEIPEIDGQKWYEIVCDDEISRWIYDTIDSAQYKDHHYEFRNKFTISEQAMMMLKLKWS